MEDSSTHARDALGTAVIIAGTVILALVVARGDAKADDAELQCKTLLDRFVELRLLAADAKLPTWSIEARRELAARQAEEAGVMAGCGANLTEANASCARDAPSIDAFERCFP